MGILFCAICVFIVFTCAAGLFIISEKFGALAYECCKEDDFVSCYDWSEEDAD